MQAADNIPAAFFIGDDGCYESDLKSCPGACRQFVNAKRGGAWRGAAGAFFPRASRVAPWRFPPVIQSEAAHGWCAVLVSETVLKS
jgi:hypothetical protein